MSAGINVLKKIYRLIAGALGIQPVLDAPKRYNRVLKSTLNTAGTPAKFDYPESTVWTIVCQYTNSCLVNGQCDSKLYVNGAISAEEEIGDGSILFGSVFDYGTGNPEIGPFAQEQVIPLTGCVFLAFGSQLNVYINGPSGDEVSITAIPNHHFHSQTRNYRGSQLLNGGSGLRIPMFATLVAAELSTSGGTITFRNRAGADLFSYFADLQAPIPIPQDAAFVRVDPVATSAMFRFTIM